MAFGGSTNTDIMSDEIFDILCPACNRKGKNLEAEKYCVECQDYFCLTCVKVHEDIPALTGHKILDKSQFSLGTRKKVSKGTRGSGQGQPSAPTERCDKHSHYYIDTYCQNHDEVGRATCMAVDHRSCKDVFYIPEFIQNNATSSIHGNIKNKLEAVAPNLKQRHGHLRQERYRLLKDKEEVLEKIRKFRREINERLDELEKNSIANTEDRYKTLISQIEEGIRMLDANKANVKSAQDKLGSPGSNISQDFVNAKKGKMIASNASQCIEHSIAHTQAEDVDFIPDQRITALLGEISVLVYIAQRNFATTQPIATSNAQLQMKINKTNSATGNTHQPDTLLEAEGGKKYSVKVSTDKNKCNIVSACAMEDGAIILSDYYNKKMKRLDSSTYIVTDYCDLPGRPWQVCPISNQDVAVCLSGEQVVQFISVGSRLTHTKEIKTDFNCYGLAYADSNLYISDFSTSVYIYNVSGHKMKQLSKDLSGQKLQSNINSLAVTCDGSKIYVSHNDKGLTVLDNNGQVVGQFNGPQLKGAYGCYLTDTGSLLVCGNTAYSSNVLQFGQYGNLKYQVLKSTSLSVNHNGKAICCNGRMTKLIIGRHNNDIEVYDLVKIEQNCGNIFNHPYFIYK